MPSSPRRATAIVAAAAPLALTGCSLGGTPDADAVIEAVHFFEDDYLQDGVDFLVSPRTGTGTQLLPTFMAPDGYGVVVRCLSDEMPEAQISDPEAVVEAAPGRDPSTSIEIDVDRPCDGGMWAAGRNSTGGPVNITITAEPGTYWVAAVLDDDFVEDEVTG